MPHLKFPHLKFVVLSILFSIGIVRAPATGQTIPSPYKYVENNQEWALFVGRSNLAPGRLDLGPRDATTFGGRYSIAFGSMSVDLSGTTFKSTREVQDISRPSDDRGIGRSDITLFMIDARLRLNLTGGRSWHDFQPFITFGAGLTFPFSVDRSREQVSFMPSQDYYNFGTRFTGTVSGGTNFHLSRRISLRLEGMMNLWKVVTPIGWLTVDNDPLGLRITDEWVNAQSIMLGASWRF